MVAYRVAVSRPALAGLERLAGRCELVIWPGDAPPGAADLARLARGCDGALVLGTDRIDDGFLDAAGDRLQVVALASMGFDAVDRDAAAARGVVVTHTPGVLAETTADIALALMLTSRRRLGPSIEAMRRGDWRVFRMDGFLGLDVRGATLGLVGYGQIAQAVARRARGFGMRVRHYDPFRGGDEYSEPLPFEELLRTSDIVSLHVPLTPETKGLIGAAQLAMMKPTATLVNTARGGIVDESALLSALRSGTLHSAGLDVMVDEPRSDPRDPLFAEPNLVVLPHVGSATEATRAAMTDLAVRNILAVLDGEDALTPLPASAARPGAGLPSPS